MTNVGQIEHELPVSEFAELSQSRLELGRSGKIDLARKDDDAAALVDGIGADAESTLATLRVGYAAFQQSRSERYWNGAAEVAVRICVDQRRGVAKALQNSTLPT